MAVYKTLATILNLVLKLVCMKKKIIKGYRDDWEFMKISEMFGTLKGDVFTPLRKML